MSGFQQNFSFEDMLKVIQTIRDFVKPREGEYSAEEYEEMLNRIKSFCAKGIEKFKYSLLIPKFLDNYADTTDPYLREYFNKITSLVDQYFLTKLKKSLVYTKKEDLEKNYLFLIDSHLAEAGDIFYNKVLDKIDIESCLSDAGRSFTYVADYVERYIQIKINKTSLFSDRIGSWHGFYNYEVPRLVFKRKIHTIPPERLATIKAKIKQKKAFTKQYITGYSMAKHSAVEATLQRQFEEIHKRMNVLCSRRQPLAESMKLEKASLDKIYQQTLKTNVDTDRMLTRRKAKVLSQIESWIKKYDTDVAAKMFLLQDVTEQLEEQKIICRDFYAEYDRLAMEYAEVVAAQLEEERMAEEKAQMEAEAAAMAAKYASKKGKK